MTPSRSRPWQTVPIGLGLYEKLAVGTGSDGNAASGVRYGDTPTPGDGLGTAWPPWYDVFCGSWTRLPLAVPGAPPEPDEPPSPRTEQPPRPRTAAAAAARNGPVSLTRS